MILVAGSANLDFVVRAHHIPLAGETVLGQGFQTFPGGKGANQAVAASRAGGATTHLLAALGEDPFSQPIEQSLSDAQVVLHAVRAVSEPTGTAFICVSDAAENAITVAPGANRCLAKEHLPTLTVFTHLLLQLETPLPTVTSYAQAARAAGICVVLNAAPAQTLPTELLAAIDILVVNEGELRAISANNGSIAETMQAIQVPTVIVTLGQQGCIAYHRGEYLLQAAYPVHAVDTTAAGDTFCGCLIAHLSRGGTLADALRFASAAAALTCTRAGAQASIPEHALVHTFLAKQTSTDEASPARLRHFCGLQ